MALNVRIEQDIKSGETARVYVEGRVDTASAPDLEKEIQPLLDGAVKQLVFDLEGLEFITSAGIRVIMAARKRMAEREGSCLLVNLQPQIEKVLEIVKALPNVTQTALAFSETAVSRTDITLDLSIIQLVPVFR